ncbi:galectin-4-like isoform X2 [Physella acuta]|uniref:galectin-4-like isoform X2 n=1 Tax=Physella acuta TaxID=109671 RepID=UPI0027DC41D7|nr:galectin-4-like isoform X2 [Physella acuta]
MGNNIQVPYSGRLPSGVQVGSEVVIVGKTPPHFDRFSINLCTGPNLDQDCAFHFNPRYHDGRVVRNHKQGGNWGGEETNGGMPFKKDHSFEIYIKATQQGYEVKVNHDHFCNFNHRIPKESVQFLHIAGDCIITSIQPLGGQSFPGQNFPPAPGYPAGQNYQSAPAPGYPAGQGYQPAPGYPAGQSYQPAPGYPGAPGYQAAPGFNVGQGFPPASGQIPSSVPIQGGLYPGKLIYISGVPSPNANRVTINLACGPNDAADISLHFDIRFNFNGERNQVVRTHKQNGTWGPEERQMNYFPFMPGTNFELMILVEQNSFKVAVNNQHFIEFAHRIQPFQRADHVLISGDITTSQVRFQ